MNRKFPKYLAGSVLLALSLNVSAEEITVSAAASLKEAFGEIAAQYQQKYPDAKINLNTAASGVLLQQIAQGAPVDVLATADEATMDKAAAQNLIQANTRKTFAHSSLVLVTPKNSSLRITKPADLLNNAVRHVAVGKPESVPAGAYTKAALTQQNVWDALQSKVVYTQNVRQALDYVTRGEADAGFVYRTDAVLQQNRLNIAATVPTVKPVSYPLAVVAASAHKAEAQRFVQYVLSANGQNVLRKYGFSKP